MRVKKSNMLNEETLGQAAANYGKNAEFEKANQELQSAKDKKIAQKFEKIGDVEFVAWQGARGDVENALDRALENAFDAELEDRISGDNVLLVGRAGTGKTERIKNWAKQRGLDLEQYQVQSLDPTDLAGIIGRDDNDPEYASRLGNKEFHRLDNPNAVLFLDEINRASEAVLGSLLTLVQNHKIVDPKEPGGMKTLPFKFTVAAMNPETEGYDVTKLDMAMRTRFGRYLIEADNEFQKEFYNNWMPKLIKIAEDKKNPRLLLKRQRQLAIANALMDSDLFRWDDEREEAKADESGFPALNPRTLTEALLSCDGTKEDFLDVFVHKCNPAKLELVEDILDSYDDIEVDDKANSVFTKYENPFAKKRETASDKLNKSHLLDDFMTK